LHNSILKAADLRITSSVVANFMNKLKKNWVSCRVSGVTWGIEVKKSGSYGQNVNSDQYWENLRNVLAWTSMLKISNLELGNASFGCTIISYISVWLFIPRTYANLMFCSFIGNSSSIGDRSRWFKSSTLSICDVVKIILFDLLHGCKTHW
jgi:hypothetical protein